MSEKKYKHQKAIDLLGKEIISLGGAVFARYVARYNKVTLEHVEAAEFLDSLMEGKLNKETENYLEPYLKPMRQLSAAIICLEKEGLDL